MSILNWLRRGVSRTASRQRAGRLKVRRLHLELLEERWDDDLKSLRGRGDFKKLLADLEGSKK